MPEEWYIRRKTQRLCVRCGQPAENGKAHCQKCLDMARESGRELREMYDRAGLCSCGRERFGNFKHCEICLERQASMYIPPELSQKYRKDSYARKKAAGICVRCNQPVLDGHTMCEKHIKEERIRGLRKYYKNKVYNTKPNQHVQWAADGRCFNCGSYDMQKGKKLCKSCYATRMITIKKAQAASPMKDYIRMDWDSARNKYIQRHGHSKYNDDGTLWEETHETNQIQTACT